MKQEENTVVEEIKSRTQCDNNFRCIQLDSRKLCHAKIVGDGRLIDCSHCGSSECLRPNPKTCPHRMSFGFGFFCTCPLRVYIAQHPNALL
jgi:hypothetical protein